MANALSIGHKGPSVSVLSRIVETLGLLSVRQPLPKHDDTETDKLREQITKAKDRHERCAEYLAAVSEHQTKEADTAAQAIRGVIVKLDRLAEEQQRRRRR
jgi:hypothetical protein